MKITNIKVQAFRAFDEPFELDLAGGKNLLLHGENGSGKSSIFLALKRFFEERGDDIAQHRNTFSPVNRESQVCLHINGKDAVGNDVDKDVLWSLATGHPLPVPADPANAPIAPELRASLVDGTRRGGFLDYRAMLRTHLLSHPLSRSNRGPAIHDQIYGASQEGLDAQLFDLVAMVILAGVRVTTSGGGEATIGALARNIWKNRPRYRYETDLRRANAHPNAFNAAFNAKLPELLIFP